MALFVQFSGTVKDAVGVDVTNFRYRGYHKESNKWSEWYNSNGIAQYNLNLGDAAWLSQSGSSNNGDHVLIVIETLETNVLARSFAMFETIIIGTITTYLQPAQIKPIQHPTAKTLWKLYSPIDNYATEGVSNDYNAIIYVGRVNERITAISTYSDEHTWIYSGKTFRHVISFYTQDIFSDRLGIVSELYAWGDTQFINTNYHYFDSCSVNELNGVFAVTAKVTNKAGLSETDILCIRIKYNIPTILLEYSPTNPTINNPVTISSTILDVDQVMEITTYKFNSVLVASNNLLEYVWVQALGNVFLEELVINANLEWSDGFVDNAFDTTIRIPMANIPPDFSLLKLVGVSNPAYTRLVVSNPIDLDGNVNDLRVRWQLEYQTPLDNTYKPILVTEYPTLPNALSKEILLDTPGNYRATAGVIDFYGGETIKTIEFVILENTKPTIGNTMWPIEWGH